MERGPAGMSEHRPPALGQVLPKSAQDKLKLTAAQRKKIKELQSMVDIKMAHILTEEQEVQLEVMKQEGPSLPESDHESVPAAPPMDRQAFKSNHSGPRMR